MPITFLRSRFNQDLYDSYRNYRNIRDSIIKPAFDSFYLPKYAQLRRTIPRLVFTDEACSPKFCIDGLNSRTMQREFIAHSDTTRQLYYNPQSDYDAIRVISGDIDTTTLKTVQLMVRQDYKQIDGNSDPMPIWYANPDKMDSIGTHVAYSHDGGSSDSWTLIASNTDSAYEYYTALRQLRPKGGFGKFRDRNTGLSTEQGALVSTVARAVDVGKFRYNKFAPRCPVYNSIQGFGYRGLAGSGNGTIGSAYYGWSFRIPTPEEISAQVWLSLNCGVDGIVYADSHFDRGDQNYGFIDFINGSATLEYDSLHANDGVIDRREPKIWLGMVSRYAAIRRVNAELRRLDTLMHLADLGYNQEQMSMHDIEQHFYEIPLLDTVKLERSVRHNASIDMLGKGYAPMDTVTFDPRDGSYMEITHYLPSPLDAAGLAANAHYCLFTNRRTWPVDSTQHYKDTSKYLGRSVVGAVRGFGAIDVRRPVITLKAPSRISCDSMIIEKVLDTTWRRTVAIGGEVALDWIEPGWGEMYRFKPVPTGVSAYGTAYNNSVHGENPSTDSTQRDRFFVYERDSAIFIRAMDQHGAISKEFLISDPADTVQKSGWSKPMHTVNNFFPSIASVREGSTCNSALAVWERDSIAAVYNATLGRTDTVHFRSVLGGYMDNRPTTQSMFPLDTIAWVHITQPKPLPKSWMQMTPAVVGMENGFVVVWADSNYQIGAQAIRGQGGIISAPEHASPIIWINSILRDTTVWADQYPTIAHRPEIFNFGWTGDSLVGGYAAGSALQDSTGAVSIPAGDHTSTYATLSVVHLAYQESSRTNDLAKIFYHKIGVDFGGTGQPLIYRTGAELVADRLNTRGCNFIHPSIAVDSVHTGIAFEALSDSGNMIVLKFRDPRNKVMLTGQRWQTPYYTWGGSDPSRSPRGVVRVYTRPSLTEFPSHLHASLDSLNYDGGLTWQWTNAGTGRNYREMLYRFGRTKPDTVTDGHDPSLLIVPNYVQQKPGAFAFAQTSVMHRGSTAQSFTGRNLLGGTGTYYPLVVENTPYAPNALFTNGSGPGRITSFFEATKKGVKGQSCAGYVKISGGLVFNKAIGPSIGPLPPTFGPPLLTPPNWCELGRFPLPPTFMPPGVDAVKFYDSLVNVWQIARTGQFVIDSCNPSITRQMQGASGVPAWLNSQPYDSTLGKPANIFVRTELVRASDSTVLWAGDTISARGLGSQTIIDTVEIPATTYASPGTEVFIRLMAVPTRGLQYDLTTGFYFDEEEESDTTETTMKMVRPETRLIPESHQAH
ncbi:MAG: hypothetical protein ABI876_03720 [Bacteroidota bacterium]